MITKDRILYLLIGLTLGPIIFSYNRDAWCVILAVLSVTASDLENIIDHIATKVTRKRI